MVNIPNFIARSPPPTPENRHLVSYINHINQSFVLRLVSIWNTASVFLVFSRDIKWGNWPEGHFEYHNILQSTFDPFFVSDGTNFDVTFIAVFWTFRKVCLGRLVGQEILCRFTELTSLFIELRFPGTFDHKYGDQHKYSWTHIIQIVKGIQNLFELLEFSNYRSSDYFGQILKKK